MSTPSQQTDAGMSALLDRFRADVYAELAAGTAAEIGPGAEAGLSLGGRIELGLGRVANALERANALDGLRRQRLQRRLQGVAPVWLPPIAYSVTGGSLKLDASRSSSADMAPSDGYVWFLTHLVVAGLVSAQGAGVTGAGTATNPGAGGTIATISAAALTALSPGGGLYQIQWLASLQGTVAAGDANNMRLTSPAGTGVENGIFPGVAGSYPQEPVTLFVPAGQSINVQAIGAASGASAVYGAQISATLLPGSGDAVTLSKVSPTGLNNVLHQFTAAQPDWQLSSSSVFLLPDDYLVLSGTGLDATQIVLSGQAVQVEQALVADYLM